MNSNFNEQLSNHIPQVALRCILSCILSPVAPWGREANVDPSWTLLSYFHNYIPRPIILGQLFNRVLNFSPQTVPTTCIVPQNKNRTKEQTVSMEYYNYIVQFL